MQLIFYRSKRSETDNAPGTKKPRKINVFAEIIIPVLWKINNFLQEIFFFQKAAGSIAFIPRMCYNGSASPPKKKRFGETL